VFGKWVIFRLHLHSCNNITNVKKMFVFS
jgi:hypothetical protein